MECSARRSPVLLMTSRQQRDSAQLTLSREVGFVRKPHANRLRVALAFPNTYFVGMSNLGFQTVYRLFNDHPDVVCERVFLPPKQELASLLQSGARLVTLESQTPVKEFDVLAFSVSFEWDYTNVLTMLRLADLPLRASDRDYRMPLVVVGGAVTFVNPEPLALFADVIAAGEGESLVPALVDACGTPSRSETLRRLAPQRGFYIPSFYDVELQRRWHHRGRTCRGWHRRAGHRQKAALKTTEACDPPATSIFTPGYRVRLPVPRGGGARLRQPVPLLLGRLQLPAGPRVPDGSDPGAGTAGTPACEPHRPGVHRALRSPRHRAHPAQPEGDELLDLAGVASARRPDADHRDAVARERRADADDCPRDRLGPAAPRDQQDGHQRGDPARRRADLLERHREPEALLHDRPADRGR